MNISLVFITQSYFSVPEEVRLTSTHYLIMKIHNKRELQEIAINHSADIDATLPVDNFLRFRKELLDPL